MDFYGDTYYNYVKKLDRIPSNMTFYDQREQYGHNVVSITQCQSRGDQPCITALLKATTGGLESSSSPS